MTKRQLKHRWTRTIKSSVVVISVLGATNAIGGNAAMCPKVHGRADYDKAWQKIVSEKRIAVEAGIKHLEQLRQSLDNDYNETVGAPGSGRDLANALLLVTRETTDVVRNVVDLVQAGPVIRIVTDVASKREKIASGTLVAADKLQAAFDNPETKAFDTVSLAIGGIVDDLKDKIPGIKLAKAIDDITAARSEYRKQSATIARQLAALQQKLQDLGGPERKYSVDALLESARAEQKSCTASTKLAPLTKAETPTDKPVPVERAPTAGADKQQKVQYSGTEPVTGACSILGTCNK